MMSVRPTVALSNVEQLGSHWMDFREYLCWGLIRKRNENIRVCLK
jgi:hypothetical protein